jgi:hypothetical protein
MLSARTREQILGLSRLGQWPGSGLRHPKVFFPVSSGWSGSSKRVGLLIFLNGRRRDSRVPRRVAPVRDYAGKMVGLLNLALRADYATSRQMVNPID